MWQITGVAQVVWNAWPWLWGVAAVDSFGIPHLRVPTCRVAPSWRLARGARSSDAKMVAGDGMGAANIDGLVEFVQLRGPSAAKLRLNPSGGTLPGGWSDATEIRARLLKTLMQVYGGTGNKYFGSGDKWTFLPTIPDGMCGFEARGIIAGAMNPRCEVELAEAFSPLMKDLLAKYASTGAMVDTVELIQDVIERDTSFDGQAVWVRAIANFDAVPEKCSISLRANLFHMHDDFGVAPVSTGAWPLAATPTEPPQPCHGARAFNSVAPCCSQTTPPSACWISSRRTPALSSSTRPRSSAAPLSKSLRKSGLRVRRATLSSSRIVLTLRTTTRPRRRRRSVNVVAVTVEDLAHTGR